MYHVVMNQNLNRAGVYIRQNHSAGAYLAFKPNPLPPKPAVEMTPKMWDLLSQADRALARLDGITELLPDPDFFIFMYVRREAASSSQIEGTQATFTDVVKAEAGASKEEGIPDDVSEVANHIKAMNEGIKRMRSDNFPLSLRLMRDIHKTLMTDVRGGQQHKTPGEFRKSQNWVGGATIVTARYVPPPVADMTEALNNLEKFIHDKQPMPDLIKIGLIHAQFETIHPFLDGNGRIGRLLITLYLCHENILRKPMLYISEYFRVYRTEYYDRLHAFHEKGDFEGWLEYFLEAVARTSLEATETARSIVDLRERDLEKTSQMGKSAHSATKLLKRLFRSPVISVKEVESITGLKKPNANSLVRRFVEKGILKQMGNRKRNRLFIYDDYVKLFKEKESFSQK